MQHAFFHPHAFIIAAFFSSVLTAHARNASSAEPDRLKAAGKQSTAGARLMAKVRDHWKQRSHLRGGKTIDPGDEVDWLLTRGKAYQWILSPEPPIWILGTMRIDASRTPAWVDFTRKVRGTIRVVPGLIKLEHDRVTIALRENAHCTPRRGAFYPERPTSFKSTPQNGVSVYVLERRKPKAAKP